MSNLEKDERRVLQLYENVNYFGENRLPHNVPLFVISTYCTYMRDITDLSEEFHRKYAKHYRSTQWYNVVSYQTNFPEDLYDLVLEEEGARLFISIIHFLIYLISNNKVSENWIKRNLYRIPPKVWSQVYE